MKKIMAVMLALMMGLIPGLYALAEGTEVPADVSGETQEKRDFLSWLDEGIEMLTEVAAESWEKAAPAIEAGWEKAAETMSSGLEWMVARLTDWADCAEKYMAEHGWDKKIEEAWETLKDGAARTGAYTQEKLEAAYRTVREWLARTGDEVDQEVAEAVDGMASAAGVTEAALAEWYRNMETYLQENGDKVTEAVQEAWDTIRKGAENAESVTAESMSQAYATLREWLDGMGEEDASGDPEVPEPMKEE